MSWPSMHVASPIYHWDCCQHISEPFNESLRNYYHRYQHYEAHGQDYHKSDQHHEHYNSFCGPEYYYYNNRCIYWKLRTCYH